MNPVVIDTNCLLQIIARKSPYRPIWDAFLAGRFDLCVSNEILEEYQEILGQQITPTIAENVVLLLLNQQNVQLVDPHFRMGIITADPDDNKFVDCAFAAGADYQWDIDPAALLDPTNKFALRSITFGMNLSCQGQTWWDEANTIKQRFYAVLGAHANGDFGPLNINVWIKNLTDTKYNTFAVQSSATGSKLTFAQRGNPFQMGVDVSFHF